MTFLSSLVSEAGLQVLCDEARKAPPGAIVEVGVYKGGSAERLWHVAREQGRELWLFDTFDGHPFSDAMDDHPIGRFADAVNPDTLREQLFGARVIVGTFPESLPEKMPPIAFVHADADLYRSTLAICTVLPPLMVEGGVILFDDYSHGDCKGCRAAVDEVFRSAIVMPDGRAKVTI